MIPLSQSRANVYVPDGADLELALSRTTHLAIAAHPDDLEIFAYHGIANCYQKKDQWFTGIILTHGGGGPRTASFANLSEHEFCKIRAEEQRDAAKLGEYSCVIQLGFSSSDLKAGSQNLRGDLKYLLNQISAGAIYLHNPADKHETHVAAVVESLKALQQSKNKIKIKKILGCEVWRDLDWLPDAKKVLLNCDIHPQLAESLLQVFRSQIEDGKDYVKATMGRRLAQATFWQAEQLDQISSATLALDLTSFVQKPLPELLPWVAELWNQTGTEMNQTLKKFLGSK